ncbi:transposase [Bdellovibrionota bacterium FG-2]
MMARFCGYIDKVFDFKAFAHQMTDGRKRKSAPTSAVWGAVFWMFITRQGSLNAVETELRINRRFVALVGKEKVSADTLGRVFCSMDPVPLREFLGSINHHLKRNKCMRTHPGMPLRFVAVDGHEFFANRCRNCKDCSERKIEVNGKEVIEYYHRGVVCHLVGFEMAIPLDVEMILPGEGELTAVKRLLERVFQHYGRFFDVVTGDAPYFNAPFFNFCRKNGKHVVAVVKNENRILLKDAEGVFQNVAAQVKTEGRKTIRYWEADALTSCVGMNEPVRVLHTEETNQRRRRRAGQWIEGPEITNWWWATSLPISLLSAPQLWAGAHHRWDIENDLFNTLGTHWSLDHCFKHNPVAILNFVLTLFIAFVLAQSFYFGNLKPVLRRGLTLIALARQLYRGLFDGAKFSWPSPLSSAIPP